MNLKEKALSENLRGLGRVAVALSGGLDSAVLLHFCASVLGAENCAAITADTPQMPASETDNSEKICRYLGVRRRVVRSGKIPEDIRNNPPERCYLCKRAMFSEFLKICAEESLGALCDGTNSDDLSDYRPGMRALRELGIRSPLLESGWTKADVREYAKNAGMPVEFAPSGACLMTRFETDAEICEADLKRVDEAERRVRSLGFSQVRVRVHGKVGRVELGAADLGRFYANAVELAPKIAEFVEGAGFARACIDLKGYESGSMNV